MKYNLVISSKAQRQFRRLDETVRKRVSEAMSGLCDNPRPHGYIKMAGEDSYRVRVGDYRVVYEIHDRTITVIVVKIAHRREAYR